MARADLLLDIVKSGAEGDRELFRNALEALIAEERAKQHHVLADRLDEHLRLARRPARPVRLAASAGDSSDLYFEERPRLRITDIFLPPAVENACADVLEEHARADLLRSHNLEPRNRVLLIGPPGNGKTSLAEGLAYELSASLLTVRYESLIGSYLGETAVRLARLFAEARTRRCVLFFDEFDVIGKERGDVHETGEVKRVVSSLLLQIDRLPSHVVVVVATNHSELLDRAVWRRFQVRVELPPPAKAQRVDWLRRFEKRVGFALGVSLDNLARQLSGLSFAELEEFALDVQRRYVLSTPGANIKSIVSRQLKQLKLRAVPSAPRVSW